MNIFKEECQKSKENLKGAIKLNFNFDNHVIIENCIKIDAKHSEKIMTTFCLSNKSIIISPLSIKETGKK